jgi:hypothetical protein
MCKPCPYQTPVTYGKDGQTSVAACSACLPGDGYINNGNQILKSCKPCQLHSASPGGRSRCTKCNGKLVDTFPDEKEDKIKRVKCVDSCAPGKGYVVGKQKENQCRLCEANEFSPGGIKQNSYKTKIHAKCERCSGMYVSDPGSAMCKKSEEAIEIERKQKEFEKQIKLIAKSVSMSEASRANLRREFASQEVLSDYYDMRKKRLPHDKKAKLQYCERERLSYEHTEDHSRQGIVVFPGVLLREEADSKACLYENRDRIIKSFCNFRNAFDITLKNRGFIGTSKSYWPNICCPSPSGNDCKVDDRERQSKMIPFATAQGGNGTADNLYSEIEDLLGHHKKDEIRTHGMLRDGMFAILSEVSLKNPSFDVKSLEEKLDLIFENINLCGPRILESPKHKKNVICQLFYPYKQLMATFHDQFQGLFEKSDQEILEEGSFIEMMESRKTNTYAQLPMATMLRSKQTAMQPKKVDYKKVEDNLFKRLQSWVVSYVKSEGSMKSKDSKESDDRVQSEVQNEISKVKQKLHEVEKITKKLNKNTNDSGRKSTNGVITNKKCRIENIKEMFNVKQLDNVKKEFCDVQHIDLDDDPEIRNFAMVHVPKKKRHGNYNAYMEALSRHAVYSIRDTCHSSIFSANDIMMQQVQSPEKSLQDTEWVILIALDSKSEDGYLSSEMPKCSIAEHLPRTELNVQIYADKNRCCKGIKDYAVCLKRRNNCRDEVKALDTSVWNSWKEQPFSFKLTVTGTIFKWELSDFILDGTLYTKLSGINYVNMEEGDVNAGMQKQSETLLLQTGMENKDAVETTFKEFVKGLKKGTRCADTSAQEIFATVRMSQERNQDFEFSCTKSPKLCKCLRHISANNKIVTFQSSNGFLRLNGNVDEGIEFEIREQSKGRRRRLLQQSRRFC